MVDCFIEVDALADDTIPEKYTMEVRYADETFNHWNPYHTQVVTIDPVNANAMLNIFETVDDARTWFYDQQGQNAVDSLNNFFGYTKFTLATLISTDYETYRQMQVDGAVFMLALNNGLGAKAEYYHTHDADDITDLTVRVGDRVDALRGVANGVASLDSSAKIRIADMPSIAYSSLTGKPTLFSGAYADLTGKPTLATVATSGSYNDLSNKPTIPTIATRSQLAVTVTLNTGAQISTTRDAWVSYTVGVANVLTLTGGAAGYVALEIATNSGFTTGLQEVGRFGNSNTGGLVIGLTLNDSIQGNISGFVPAGYYRRLRTVNTTGTPTYTYLSGQETLL